MEETTQKQLIAVTAFADNFPTKEDGSETIEAVCIEYYEKEPGNDKYDKFSANTKEGILELIKPSQKLTNV
jgi:hypothetical protein